LTLTIFDSDDNQLESSTDPIQGISGLTWSQLFDLTPEKYDACISVVVLNRLFIATKFEMPQKVLD